MQYTLPDDIDTPLDRSEFRKLAGTLQGSRDVGAQLFCALLRSVGVDARLVSSLQPLPFLATTPPAPISRRRLPEVHVPDMREPSSGEEVDNDIKALARDAGALTAMGASSKPLVPQVARRLGGATYGDGQLRDPACSPSVQSMGPKKLMSPIDTSRAPGAEAQAHTRVGVPHLLG